MTETRWTFRDAAAGLGRWEIVDVNGRTVAIVAGTSSAEAQERGHKMAAAPSLYEALADVHALICEGAETGFNPLTGDWAERLFASNAKTSDALRSAGGSGRSEDRRAARGEG